MKKQILLFCLFAVSSLHSHTQGQSAADKLEPEFYYQPAYLTPDSSLVNLRLERVTRFERAGIGKSDFYFVWNGTRSSVRLPANQESVLFIKVNDLADGGLQNEYRLFGLTVNERKQTRTCLFAKQKRGLASFSNTPEVGTPFLFFKRFRDNIYMVGLYPLAPGEYAVTRGENTYTFGID